MSTLKKIEIEKKAFLEDGSTIKFTCERNTIIESGFVVFFEGQYHAYINQCKHMPIELDYKPNEFMDDEKQWILCSTHGAIYHPATGECVAGPCRGKLLEKLNIIESNDVLWIEI